MTEIKTKIILAMMDRLPLTIRQIAEDVRANATINRRKCEAKCKYHVEDLVASGVIESFTNGNRNMYKLCDGIEVLRGKLILFERDDDNKTIKYEINVEHVMRAQDGGIGILQ